MLAHNNDGKARAEVAEALKAVETAVIAAANAAKEALRNPADQNGKNIARDHAVRLPK